jgi:L-ascorbate metabolism protein UlaG (beta-lactamase superfamily)
LTCSRRRHGVFAVAVAAAIAMPGCGSPDPIAHDGTPSTDDADRPVIASAALTWFSIGNWYLRIGEVGIVIDGYLTRIPASNFHGGTSGFSHTDVAWPIDTSAIDPVIATFAAEGPIDLIVIGHSHFDHAHDAAYWASQTGAMVIAPRTTCLQLQGQGVAAERCLAVDGGERVDLRPGLTLRVVRWNHAGTSPEQHDPVELAAVPVADGQGRLRAGMREDFPNGGGSRGYLFTIDTAGRPTSIYVQDTGSAFDLGAPSTTDGIEYAAPLDNLRDAMADAGLSNVDLWIATGDTALARMVVPILAPATVVPSHWDGLYAPFADGLPYAFADPALAAFLGERGIAFLPPTRYLERYELDASGTHRRASAFADRWGFSETTRPGRAATVADDCAP